MTVDDGASMKTYIVKYICADDELQEETSFIIEASSIAKAVAELVASFRKDYNPANIDFVSISADGEDLGEDGIYAAEVALADYYT